MNTRRRVTVEEVRAALIARDEVLARRVTIRESRWGVTVVDPSRFSAAPLAAAALRKDGYLVESEAGNFMYRVSARPTGAGLRTRQQTERGYKGRRYRVAGHWDLLDAEDRVVGQVWRAKNRVERREYDTRDGVINSVKATHVEQKAAYRVSLDGFPENPREYPTLGAAVKAAEQARARRGQQ